MKYHARTAGALCAAMSALVLSACAASGGAAIASRPPSAAAPASVASLVKAAKSEKGLVIYGNAPTVYLQPVITAFQKHYPFIKVSDTALGDNTVFSKYEAEAAQGARTADLLIASAPASWVQAERNGVTANVKPLGLSNFPSWVSQGHSVYVMSAEPIVEVYNPKLLPASQVPRTYAQLAADTARNPGKYKLVSYPIDDPLAYGGIYGLIHILGAGNVWRDYAAMAPNTKTYSEGLAGLQQIIQGGASIGYMASGLAQGVLPHYKGLAAYTFMKDATPLVPRGIAVTAKATSPASAQLFLDFLFSKPGQDALCAGGFEATMNNYQPSNGCTASLTSLRKQVPPHTTYLVPISQALLNQQAAITQRWNQAFHR